MARYDYEEALKNDILEYINENNVKVEDYEELDEMYNDLYDDLWVEDSVTGNASGSYTFNTYQAEENLCHNLDLLGEALTEFGCDADYLSKNGAESADVTIRCYLPGGCLMEVLEEMWEE